MPSTWLITVDVDLDDLAENVCQIAPLKVTLSLPFHTVFFGMNSVCSLHLRSYVLPPWSWCIYVNYLVFFCMGDLSLLSHLFIHHLLCHYGHMDIYFVCWVIIQYTLLILLLIWFQLQQLGAFSVGSCFLWHTPMMMCFVSVFSTFLLSGVIKFPRLILCILCTSSRTSRFFKEFLGC